MRRALALLRPPHPPTFRPAPRPASYALHPIWQTAYAFNQPLSFDTSSVTDMYCMFFVRSSPYPALNLQSSPPLHAAHAPRSPAASRLPVLCTSSRTVCPPFDSRQRASTFNQPLSFNTSSVTDMAYMFFVRSSPSPAPSPQSSPPLRAACTAVARHLPPPGTLHLAPHRMPSVRLSAARVVVQPTAELRHLQRHDHALHVQRALLPVACSQSAVKPCPARRVDRGRPPPPASWYSAPRTTPHALCSTLGSARRCSTGR